MNNKVNRNVFDCSFVNHLTTKIGQITPVFCKEVLPGESVNISAAFGLRFMPMVFPVQSRMRAKMHFYYVRNRNLWSEWANFIGNHGDEEFPTISPDREGFFHTGSLADYLGIPTSRASFTSPVTVSKATFDPHSFVFNYCCPIKNEKDENTWLGR